MRTRLEKTFVFPLLKVSSDSLALTATRRLVRDNLHLKARGDPRLAQDEEEYPGENLEKGQDSSEEEGSEAETAGGTLQEQLRNSKSLIFGALTMTSSFCITEILGSSSTFLMKLLCQYP